MNSKFLFALACCLGLSLPASAQKADLAHGTEIFKANCQMCHPGGDNALDPSKSLKGAAFLKRYGTDEAIAQRIREGSSNGRMPAFPKSGLNDKELVDVIKYIRSLSPAPKPATAKTIKTKSETGPGKTKTRPGCAIPSAKK